MADKTYLKHHKTGEVVEIIAPKPGDLADIQRYGLEFTQKINAGFEECAAPGEPVKPKPKQG